MEVISLGSGDERCKFSGGHRFNFRSRFRLPAAPIFGTLAQLPRHVKFFGISLGLDFLISRWLAAQFSVFLPAVFGLIFRSDMSPFFAIVAPSHLSCTLGQWIPRFPIIFDISQLDRRGVFLSEGCPAVEGFDGVSARRISSRV